MIKRVSKAKKSKQGAILVIVVLILALAMIFIASAMMLTQATRDRVYEDAVSSQSRLTVTAASEVFLEALEKQEITDAQIDSMLSAKTTRATDNTSKIKMVISGVPGMSEASDNCTYLDMYYPDPSDTDIVNCDFTTTIGDSVENVRIVLKANEDEPSYGGRFMNQIDVAGNVGTSNVRFSDGVGMVNPALGDVTDNTILFRSGVHEQTSEAVFFSDLVFVNGDVKIGGGNLYNGNMIFLADAYMSSRSSVGGFGGDFYFVGSADNPGFKHGGNDDVWGHIKDSSAEFIFSGRSVQNDNSDGNGKIQEALNGKNCYFVGHNDGEQIAAHSSRGSYTITNTSGTLDSGKSSRLSLYKAYNYGTTDLFPTDVETQVLAKYSNGTRTITAGSPITKTEYAADGSEIYRSGDTATSDLTVVKDPVAKSYSECGKDQQYAITHTMSEQTLYEKNATDGTWGSSAMPEGYYYITPGKTTDNNNSAPVVVAINGANANGYRFYFAPGDHYINNLVFAVYNVAAADQSPVMFILEDGAKLHFSGANFRNTNYFCTAGFLSVDRGITSASTIKTFVQTNSSTSEDKEWSSEHKKRDGSQIKYSRNYDGIKKPCAYVIGVGNNNFDIGDCMTIEGYVGLYGSSVLDLVSGLNSRIPIYGRIEANQFGTNDNPTGQFMMPYCPAPGNVDNRPDERRAETKYEVVNIVYYYGEGSVPTTTTT